MQPDAPLCPQLPDDRDLAAAAPRAIVKAASGLVMITGFSAVLVGLQNLLGFELFGVLFALPLGMLVLGVTAMAIGWLHGKAQTWAAVASLLVAATLLAASVGWLLVSVASGGLSLLAFGTVGLGLVSVIVTPFSFGACRRATEARARLRQAGMDLGL